MTDDLLKENGIVYMYITRIENIRAEKKIDIFIKVIQHFENKMVISYNSYTSHLNKLSFIIPIIHQFWHYKEN